MLARAPYRRSLINFRGGAAENDRGRTTGAPSTTQGLAPASPASGFAVFADVVQRFAAENDVVYAPKPNRTHDGKQLCVRAGDDLPGPQRDVREAGHGYVPVALEDLLAQTLDVVNNVFQLDVGRRG